MFFFSKSILISILGVLLFIASYAQNGFEIRWNNPSIHEIPFRFVNNNDTGFAGLVTKIKENGVGNNNTAFNYVYQISQYGDTTSVVFSKQDTTFQLLYILHVKSEPSGYILVGYGYSLEDGPEKYLTFFLRVNENLELIWQKVYFFNLEYHGLWHSMIEETNGNLLYCCTPEGQYMLLFRMSPEGDSLSYRQYEGDECGQIYSITYNHDSSNILLHTDGAYYDWNTARCKIITLDSNWNQLYYTDYPRDLLPNLSAQLLPNGKILTCGRIFITPEEDYLAAYVLNNDLSIQYEFDLKNPDTASQTAANISVDFYESNTYIGGTCHLINQNNRDLDPGWFYVAKVNDTLGIEYEKYIGGDAMYWLYSIAASADGGVLLAGTRQELTNDTVQYDGYLIKLDANGILTGTNKYPNIQIKDALIYPNPGGNQINILTGLQNSIFSLFDESGKLVLTKRLTEKYTNIPVQYLGSGKYYYVISQQNEKIESGTWIKGI